MRSPTFQAERFFMHCSFTLKGETYVLCKPHVNHLLHYFEKWEIAKQEPKKKKNWEILGNYEVFRGINFELKKLPQIS